MGSVIHSDSDGNGAVAIPRARRAALSAMSVIVCRAARVTPHSHLATWEQGEEGMLHELEGIISQYERGTISRRQLLGALALALAAAGGGEAQAQTAPVVCPGLTLNHFHLD